MDEEDQDPIASATSAATAETANQGNHGAGMGMTTEPDPKILNVAQCTDLMLEKIHENPEQAYLLRRFLSNILSRHGWSAALRHRVVEYIKKEGPNNVNVSHMWGDLAAEALEAIPDPVRVEVKDYLTQLAHTFIEVDDSVQVPEEEVQDEKLYEFQSRDTVPEPPSGLYPPPSPAGPEHTKYVKPQWLFVYDKPTPKTPTDPNSTASATAAAAAADSRLPSNGSETTGSSDNYESSSDSSPYSNTNTPPETHGDGDHGHGVHGDEADHDQDDIPSPGSSLGSESSRKNLGVGRQGDKDKDKDKDKERERKRMAAKQQQQQRQQQGDRPRPLKTGVVDENRKSKPSTSGRVGVAVPVSPHLTVPLRQLKIVDKKVSMGESSGSTSKLSPSAQQQLQQTTSQQQQPGQHKTKGDRDGRRGGGGAGSSNDLVEDEEEEELMDV